MGSPWKTLSDDNRRQTMLLLRNKEMIRTQMAEDINLSVSTVPTSLSILKEADLITEIKKGQNRFYSLNKNTKSELVQSFDDMYDYNLNSLKEYVENKESKGRRRRY